VEIYKQKILVLDCELKVREIIYNRLTLRGYQILFAANEKDALLILQHDPPCLVVLDITTPGVGGYELCYKIKKRYNLPVIILTALMTLSNRIKGLEVGANKYITKPFSPIELELTINSLLNNKCHLSRKIDYSTTHHEIVNIGNLTINFRDRKVFKSRLKLNLTHLENCLLELFLENVNKPLSRGVILDNIWGYKPQREIDTRIVDVHISRLRVKIEEDPRNPYFIITVRGIGYFFRKQEIN